MKIEIKKWPSVSDINMTLTAVQELYSKPEKYKFIQNQYDIGARFSGTLGLPCTMYMLEGVCRFLMGDEEITISAGEFAEFERSSYICEVLGNSKVHFIRVVKLPSVDLH